VDIAIAYPQKFDLRHFALDFQIAIKTLKASFLLTCVILPLIFRSSDANLGRWKMVI
jgi:hypothetical protein